MHHSCLLLANWQLLEMHVFTPLPFFRLAKTLFFVSCNKSNNNSRKRGSNAARKLYQTNIYSHFFFFVFSIQCSLTQLVFKLEVFQLCCSVHSRNKQAWFLIWTRFVVKENSTVRYVSMVRCVIFVMVRYRTLVRYAFFCNGTDAVRWYTV